MARQHPKLVVVTGATRGLGRAMTDKFVLSRATLSGVGAECVLATEDNTGGCYSERFRDHRRATCGTNAPTRCWYSR